MHTFLKAIVCTPCEKMVDGLTTVSLGKPDYKHALRQHTEYIRALKDCGVEVIVLDADNAYPDSTFVEDTALLTSSCAIIMNIGASSRRGEVVKIQDVLISHFDTIEYIKSPGTVDAGDILMIENHYFIGVSQRTNRDGAQQLITILKKYGMTGSIIEVENVLHLKAGVAYLENNNLVVSGEFNDKAVFQNFNLIKLDDAEQYAANCVWINGTVLIAKGYPKTKSAIEAYGYKTIDIDVSEFRKLDGGLSCLSLRF